MCICVFVKKEMCVCGYVVEWAHPPWCEGWSEQQDSPLSQRVADSLSLESYNSTLYIQPWLLSSGLVRLASLAPRVNSKHECETRENVRVRCGLTWEELRGGDHVVTLPGFCTAGPAGKGGLSQTFISLGRSSSACLQAALVSAASLLIDY